MALPEALFVGLAQRLSLAFLGIEDGFVRFSGENNGHTVSVMADTDARHFHLIVTHPRYPRGLSILPVDGKKRALITGDETFDRLIQVAEGGAGALALLRHSVRLSIQSLFTETDARITLGRIQAKLTVPERNLDWVVWALEIMLWIGRRLAHPLTIFGLVDNVLDDPDPEVKMANLRMLWEVAPETLERLPETHQGLQLAPLVEEARLQVESAGRLSIVEPRVEGALSPAVPQGALSLKRGRSRVPPRRHSSIPGRPVSPRG